MNILEKALNSTNTPNIILYGIDTSDIREKLYNILSITDNKTHIINKDLSYYKSNSNYIFNISLITNKNVQLFLDTIDEIVKSKNYYNNSLYKIIIFENFIKIKQGIQNILRVKIEKYRITTIFIILTTNINGIIQPLKSRCLCIRNPSLTMKEKRELIKSKINYKNLNTDFYDKIYEIDNLNIISFMCENKTLIDMGYESPYELIIKRIINLYKLPYNKNIHNKIREISYNILKFNLSIPLFYKIFLCQLLDNSKITDNKKIKLIVHFSESQYNLIKSYRLIINIESLLINVYSILSDALLTT